MPPKSQEEFQKDILAILKQQGDKMKEVEKRVEEKLAGKPGIVQKEQMDKDSDYGYVSNFIVSGKSVSLESEEEAKMRIKKVGEEVKALMIKYRLSKLECFVIKNYGQEKTT